jgi:two-component system, LytTR family, sensor kinase
MEKLSELLLRFYPLEKVSFKRRVFAHCIFWGLMFCSFYFGLGLPSFSWKYKFSTAVFTLITCAAFFYLIFYVFDIIDKKFFGIKKYIIIIFGIGTFYFFYAFCSYLKVILIIENNWYPLKSGGMYLKYLREYYQSGFWTFFKFDTVFADTYEVISISMPAFFLKFLRIFSRNLIEKKQLEIDFLRLQINPHFLTNTLNNIYSLVVTEDQRSPDAILSLSNLLDYVLYESSLPEVSVEKEIKFLEDFIELERIRNSQKLSIDFTVQGDLHGKIAPLILIAFIENAFKHGVGDSTIGNYINVSVSMIENTLLFKVNNSKPTKQSQKRKTSLGGIGLENTKRRLESLYPKCYELIITNERNIHEISLSLQLKSKE